MKIVFAPLIGGEWLLVLAVLSALLVGICLFTRLPGSVWRGVAAALLLAVLANPMIVRERREILPDIVALIIDDSPSQQLDGRADRAAAAAELIRARLARLPDLQLREMRIGESLGGTRLFAAVEKLMFDVPAERVAGIIMISDGQVHDVPPQALQSQLSGPVHALLTGNPEQQDRRLSIAQAPKFGIVGETLSLRLQVDDGDPAGDRSRPQERQPGTAQIALRLNGGPPTFHPVEVGEEAELRFKLSHAGANVVELSVDPGPEELTLRNNRTALMVNGVRDRLRVLLVSGEPHPGERTWRNLLKADPGVDMVHFTILRPPEKQDGTPVDELSLISFPTRELFSIKLHEFDLIIFDRYKRRGVLPFTYFDNIANYVDQGGALLVAAGPAFASGESLYRTPLAIVFPAQPTGKIKTGGFRPQLTDLGARHPVTETLPGANSFADDGGALDPPRWGRWFRFIETEQLDGKMLLSAPDGAPLLLLDEVGEGRVAQLLSDHSWLWARGFDGGGPQAELLRRLAHWLMKEPDLEEENLYAEYEAGEILIERRSVNLSDVPVLVEFPDGHSQLVEMMPVTPGKWRAQIEAQQPGIYHLRDGRRSTIVAAGDANPVEFADVRATENRLAPVVAASGGAAVWLRADGVPDIRRVGPGRDMAGQGWIGLRENRQYLVAALEQHSLLPALLMLLLIAAAIGFAWRSEGR